VSAKCIEQDGIFCRGFENLHSLLTRFDFLRRAKLLQRLKTLRNSFQEMPSAGRNLSACLQHKVRECHEDIKCEQQLLSARLEIVERLKDILEQQIGAGSVQNIMEHFAETSQQTLSVSSYM